MKTNTLHDNLIFAIRERLPHGANMANTLMDILFIGKEAVYRRLRGEVPFTLSEIAALSKELGLSVDQVIGSCNCSNAIFRLSQLQYDNLAQTDYSALEASIRNMKNMYADKNCEIGSSANTLPFSFLLKYDNLSKLRLFKWKYNHSSIKDMEPFNEMIIPDKLQKIQLDYGREILNISNTYHIWDSMIFLYMINDIKYFASINFISRNEVLQMKEEMLMLLDDIEDLASCGRNKAGNKVEIYISDTNFEATYTYVQSQQYNLSLIWIFTINAIVSSDENMFRRLKEWIQSLKRFAVLISESGEMQRVQFFRKQRELIASI